MQMFFKCSGCGEHRVIDVHSEEEATRYAYPDLLTGCEVRCFKCGTQMTHVGKWDVMMDQMRAEGEGRKVCLPYVVFVLFVLFVLFVIAYLLQN